MADLQRCPFCGSHNVGLADLEPSVGPRGVVCDNCGAIMPGRIRTEAADKWNRRADLTKDPNHDT